MLIPDPSKESLNQCITVLAHYMGDKLTGLVNQLQQDCEGKYDVWLIYDNSRQDYDPSVFARGTKSFLFDDLSISKTYAVYNHSCGGGIYGGNCTFPILEFYRHQSQYACYWRIEYDVRFNGDWCRLFDYFSYNNADLLTTTLFRRSNRPDWAWWKSLKTPWYIWNVDCIRGYLPVARMSNRACELLYRNYRRKWAGHDEVVVPTLLNHYGMRLEDIGGEGEFVHPENKTRFYANSPGNRKLTPGTFVCPPAKPELPMQLNMLYHAIK